MNERIEKQSLSIFSFEIGTHTGCGRHIGFMVRVLTSGWSCPGLSPGGEHCVHGQDTLFSQYPSPPRCINFWVPANLILGVTL